MNLHLTTHQHLRFTLHAVTKTVNNVSIRSLTAVSRHYVNDPEADSLSFNDQIFGNNYDLSNLKVLHQYGHLSIPYLFNKFISLCTKLGCFDVGVQLHPIMVKMGFVSNVYISSAFVDMYGKCSNISSAQKLFDEMPYKNVVTWNSLISGYLENNIPKKSFELFVHMLKEGIGLTPFSISAMLVGCSQLGDEEFGAQAHGLSLKAGFDYHVVVGTGLIDMYWKCWNVEDARWVFDQMIDKNVFTWTSMVTAYAQNGQPDKAMILVREMLRLGFRSNYVTYNSLLSSFSSPDHVDYCKQIHCHIIQEGLESNAYIVVTLGTVYSKCSRSLEDFWKVCSGIAIWDQVSWNAVISGFTNLGCGEEALKFFSDMRRSGIEIDFFTLTSVVGAVGIISALEEGKQIHALILKKGYASNVCIQNGLVSMYASCGAINDSKSLFSSMDEHDLISWNSLLSGCAHHGYGREAVELFELMRKLGMKQDSTTFLAVLSACSHVGLLDKGLEYFDLMRNDPSLEPPRVEHYASVVDLFGRAGCLTQAESFISSMAIEPGPSVYKALLSAAQVHGNKEIADRAAENLLQLWPNDPATYILLSNVMRTTGHWDDAAGVRKLMSDRGVKKKPGHSWI